MASVAMANEGSTACGFCCHGQHSIAPFAAVPCGWLGHADCLDALARRDQGLGSGTLCLLAPNWLLNGTHVWVDWATL